MILSSLLEAVGWSRCRPGRAKPLRGTRRTSAAKASAQEWTGNRPQPIAHFASKVGSQSRANDERGNPNGYVS